MAVPKNKKSKMKKRSRRAQAYKLDRVTTTTCPNCGEPVMPHRVCKSCGYYGGKEVLDIED